MADPKRRPIKPATDQDALPADAADVRLSLTESQEAAMRRRGAFLIRLNLVLALLAVVTTAGAFTAIFQRPYPAFIGLRQNAQGQIERQQKLSGLAAPIRNTKSVAAWAGRVATMSYTYTYADFDDRMRSLRGSFTPGGWTAYVAAQEANKFRETLQSARLFFTASLINTPVVTNQAMIAGVMTYQVEVPLNITYANTGGSKSKQVLITMTIEQVPTAENPRGLGVVNYIEKQMAIIL